jgi:hypothetical protein
MESELAPAVFGASRLSVSMSAAGDAARAGHSWPPFLRRTYRARGSGCYRGLADLLSKIGDARGVRSGPSQCRTRPAVDRRLVDADRTHLPLVRCAVRECTLARSDRYVGIAGRGGFGFWGRLRGSGVPRRSPVPPRLLRTGPDAPRWPELPWASGPLSGLRRTVPAPPFLAMRTPLGFGAGSRHDCRSHRGVQRLPFGVSKGTGD